MQVLLSSDAFIRREENTDVVGGDDDDNVFDLDIFA